MNNEGYQTQLGQPLLTIGDLQKHTHLSRPTLIRLHDSGALPAIEILKEKKRLLRWRPETVRQFIAEREKHHGTQEI